MPRYDRSDRVGRQESVDVPLRSHSRFSLFDCLLSRKARKHSAAAATPPAGRSYQSLQRSKRWRCLQRYLAARRHDQRHLPFRAANAVGLRAAVALCTITRFLSNCNWLRDVLRVHRLIQSSARQKTGGKLRKKLLPIASLGGGRPCMSGKQHTEG